MQTEKCNSESTNILTTVESRLYKRFMPRIKDVLHGLTEQLDEDIKALDNLLDEQNKLRSAHIRFMNLEEESNQKLTRVKRLATMLSGVPETAAKTKRFGIAVEPNDTMPLWELIIEVLRQTGELQVVDLHQLLACGLIDDNVSRQGIESALAKHSKAFEIKRRGREKFVSLKK
jgi:hypothetical protein